MPGGTQSASAERNRGLAADLAATPLGRAFWLIWALTVLWIACFDPFGLDSRVETTTETMAQRLLANRYPDAAARHIALIEVTAADIDQPNLDLRFPLSPEVMEQMVRALTAAGVRAIFIDSEFRNPAASAGDIFADPGAGQPRKGPDVLAAAIMDARAAGVAVLTGPIGPRDDLDRLRRAASRTEVSWSVDHLADYALRNEAGDTAAAALYRVVCSGRDPLPECSPSLLHRIDRGAAAPMALRFGGSYPAEQWRFSGTEEQAACRNRPALLPALRRELWGSEPATPCTHHLVIPAAWLLLAQNKFGELAAMLKGRVVMIGAGPGMGDDHVIPGVGRIPGVAVHAMALDNLLSWGTSYPRWPADFVLKIGPDELLKLLALLALPWLLSYAAARLCAGQRDSRAIAWRTAAVALAGSAVLVLAALACAAAFAWPLSVALTIAGMSTLVANLLSGPHFHRALRPFADRRGAAVLLALFSVAAMALLAPALLPALALLATLAALVALSVHLTRRLGAARAAPAVDQAENAK
ncbi:CHASE2 domain-containing protein [Sphingomonas sp. R-74633]|uniref:CHASE2 domain-containing protein n=1 Tax=Sphingomonas sp. R-74633 TaxID=2751188 RepID=UPI0015D27767|nr:CHASE2 domain-containing protein [Sphingomonas sp. R-74633]NYT41403.1 CHASE2 domain-containing protein [Sphingomonas sp. R-74633]